MAMSTIMPAAPSHDATVFVAFELSKAQWKVGIVLPQSRNMSRYTIAGGDTGALAELLTTSRRKAERRCGVPVRMVSCYEAGYDGFWLDRWLADYGVINHVLDPASIEVNRRLRRAKTDRIDLEKLMRALLAHLRGEAKACSVVRVPSVEEEDAKRGTRELERLTRERGGHINRIKALLHGQGVRDVKPAAKRFLRLLPTLRSGDGRGLPPQLAAEITREHARLRLVEEQLAAIAREMVEMVQTAPAGSTAAKARLLMALPWYRARWCSPTRCSPAASPTGARSAATSASPARLTTAARRSVSRASARPAIAAPARSPSSSPGSGCATSRRVH